MLQDEVKPRRSTHQIVSDGKPAKATSTSNLWISRPGVFSKPTWGNEIEPLTSGEAYFNSLISALDTAQSEVLIAGWQVNWDALLAEGVRLYDVVYRNARRGVKFYVMPWDDANPVQTYETQTQIVLESINDRLKREKVANPGRVMVIVAASQSDRNKAYFSHHQKQVVVDRKVGFVGGIDLAYGRYDDHTFSLEPKSRGRWFLNSYNPGLPPLRTLSAKNQVDPDLMSGGIDSATGNASKTEEAIKNGAYQARYKSNAPVNNNPSFEGNEADLQSLDVNQPRMPWQDVHCRIEGPAVDRLAMNFVRRWNSLKPKVRLAPPALREQGQPDDKAGIQVLRSAPAVLVAAERAAGAPQTGSGPESDIHTAMKRLIEKADRFIYIESQFFVSGFGQLGGPTEALSPAAQFIKDGAGGISDKKLGLMRRWDDEEGPALDQLPQNGVCAALVERIAQSILDAKRPYFHVYVTLPVHPEGSLLDGAVAVQVYWTMQSLVFGSNSLINGIRRALKARELRDTKDSDWQRVFAAGNNEHESIDTERCFEYVTLLNLRNWARLEAGGVVTEQVYVHTKLMIVDDLYVLLGSANINDRSLLGSRDSELAVLVMDGQTSRADINGAGSQRPVRKFAHELRKQVWTKLFGISGSVRPANELKQAIDQPGSPSSWRAIQSRAKKNAELYEAAFPWVPRSRVTSGDETKSASIIPNWDATKTVVPGKSGAPSSPLPYQREYWQSPPTVDASGLSAVRGFICALPIEWTRGENIRIPYPTSLIVRHDRAPIPDEQRSAALAAAAVNLSGEHESAT